MYQASILDDFFTWRISNRVGDASTEYAMIEYADHLSAHIRLIDLGKVGVFDIQCRAQCVQQE